MEEEYEMIPMGPIRKLERRVDRVEKTGATTETIRELVDIVRSNQRVIDDIVKINSDMMNRVSNLISSVGGLNDKINDFMSRIEMTSEPEPQHEEVVVKSQEKEEKYKEIEEKVGERMDKLEKRVNLLILSLSKAKLRRQEQVARRPAPA